MNHKALTLATAAISLTALAACTNSDTGGTPFAPNTSNQKADVQEAAQDFFDATMAGEYETAWEYFDHDLRQVWSQDTYVRVQKACNDTSLVITAVDPEMVSEKKATIGTEVFGIDGPRFTLVAEDGEWKFAPTAENRANEDKTAGEIIREYKAQGNC